MRNEASVEIEVAIDEVFFMTNEQVQQWSDIVVEDRPQVPGETGVGSKSVIITEDRGHRMEFDTTVTDYDPPHRSAVHMEGSTFNIDAVYLFEPLGVRRTRVTQTSTVQGKGLMRWIMAMLGWWMQKSSCEATAKELNSLKRYCEQQAAR